MTPRRHAIAPFSRPLTAVGLLAALAAGAFWMAMPERQWHTPAPEYRVDPSGPSRCPRRRTSPSIRTPTR